MDSHDLKTDRKTDITGWLRGVPYEVAFWRSYYGNRRRRADLFGWSLYGKPCRLDGFDIDGYIASLDVDEPVILDVGCALSYAFGNVIAGRERPVGYVDPLAPFYNRILDRYGIDRPRISFGMVEMLSASYGEGNVDFIHVRNALDHCADPFEGILQCLVSLRRGGVLYLNHFVNEAEREAYRGFHRFNLKEEEGRLILWNRQSRLDVGACINGFAELTAMTTPEGRVVAVITKRGDVPPGVCDLRDTARRASDAMMETVGYFHRFPNVARYQWQRAVATCGHRLMRLLPHSSLEGIKKLFKKL